MRALVVAVVGLVVTAVAAGTGGAVPAAIDPPSDPAEAAEPTDGALNQSNVSVGTQLSSFMQSSAAQASGSVETGMWVAAYANASNRSRESLVTRRTDQLSSRIAELQAEKRALQAAKRNGSLSTVEYRSRLSRIVGRLAALKAGVEAVDRPNAPGLNRSRIATINRQADELAGPEISDLARSLGGPKGAPGPPDWVETGPDANRSNGNPAAGVGEGGPDKAANASAADDAGPPDDAGNGTDPGQGDPPDDPGNSGSSSENASGQASDNGSSTGEDNPGNGNGEDNPGQGADQSDNANDKADDESDG